MYQILVVLLVVLGWNRVPVAVRISAATAYLAPDPEGGNVTSTGIAGWGSDASILWYGHFIERGAVNLKIAVTLPVGDTMAMTLIIGSQAQHAIGRGIGAETIVDFGAFQIADTGFVRIAFQPGGKGGTGRQINALILDGAPATSAHFNLDPRRNAASVHLRFPIDSSDVVTGFYNEVTAVDDPVATYYMATGFSRGYFGMQVNSATERRIIFSVWDAANGTNAKDRSTVASSDQTTLVAKGDGVVASVFGNEGTGGHSHLVYNWKTGSAQKFYVTAEIDGDHTIYSGYWYHPEKKAWQLIASFRAARDGGALRRLYSFSEDFDGATGNLLRKALYGPPWIKLASGAWRELSTASFTHDATGKENRIDRFMGIENGKFFLSHGGFVPGTTASGTSFSIPAAGKPPEIKLP